MTTPAKTLPLLLALLMLLTACAPTARPSVPVITQQATPENVVPGSASDIVTFSVVLSEPGSRIIVSDTTISVSPSDIPETHLLSEDAAAVRAFLKEHRAELLNANAAYEAHTLGECPAKDVRVIINGVGNSIHLGGCADDTPQFVRELVHNVEALGVKYSGG
jgi:hypothetical protein